LITKRDQVAIRFQRPIAEHELNVDGVFVVAEWRRMAGSGAVAPGSGA